MESARRRRQKQRDRLRDDIPHAVRDNLKSTLDRTKGARVAASLQQFEGTRWRQSVFMIEIEVGMIGRDKLSKPRIDIDDATATERGGVITRQRALDCLNIETRFT